MEIDIIKVSNRNELSQFIDFPKDLYKSDPNFIFEPTSMQKEFLSTKNPFFDHSNATYYLAKVENKLVGRIASIINTAHNEVYNEKTGFFGFFEVIEDYNIAKVLIDTVVNDHHKNGFDSIIGPTNFTTNDSCGFLISGFESPPVVMMPYNKPYYNDFIMEYGFEKIMDLSSYSIKQEVFLSPSYVEFEKRIRSKIAPKGITIRTINYKNFDQELISFREVYNQSNANNWGFIPLSEREFKHTAYQLKQFVPEKFMLIAEKEGKQIGFLVALPDLNQVFSRIRSGRLFPFGFIKFLWYQKKVNNSRVLILGLLDEYRNKGIDFMLYKKIHENLTSMGIYQSEACYVMESNIKMNSILNSIQGTCIKKYRIYKKPI